MQSSRQLHVRDVLLQDRQYALGHRLPVVHEVTQSNYTSVHSVYPPYQLGIAASKGLILLGI